MKRLLLLLAVAAAFVATLAPAFAAPEAPLTRGEAALRLREADDAFLAGRFDDAAGGYRSLVEAGYGTADVHYNLGNAALSAGRLGEAVLAYERALRRDPGHADAQANLALARSRNVDKLVGASAGPPFLERLARAVPATPLTWAFAGAWVLLFGALVARRVGARARTTLAVLAIVGFVASAGLGLLLGVVVWHHEQVTEAVVMDDAAPVRKGPAPRFETAFEVHEGLTARVVQVDGPYARIRLANGLEGWVLRKAIEEI